MCFLLLLKSTFWNIR